MTIWQSKFFLTTKHASAQSGIDKAANTVKVTLGPRGRNVRSTKATAARLSPTTASLSLKKSRSANKFENMGAEIVKEVASKTNDIAGDGTTTSVVLLQAIVEEGMKHTEAGLNAMGVRAASKRLRRGCVALAALAKKIQTTKRSNKSQLSRQSLRRSANYCRHY
jgi:chaperonin GroEL